MLTRKLNPYWTIEKADPAMLAESELIKRNAKPRSAWLLLSVYSWPRSEIEREYQFYQNDREWPES